jgi:ArsR family transcriptional regulator
MEVNLSRAIPSGAERVAERAAERRGVAVSDDLEVCCPSVLGEPLAEAEAQDLAQVFAALADPVRLRLLSLVADAGEICSCDLQDPLGKAQPTVSHHTRVLGDAGLIVGEKRGRWVWWRIVPERMAAVRAALDVRA